MRLVRVWLFVAILFGALPGRAPAAPASEVPSTAPALDATTRKAVIEGIIREARSAYFSRRDGYRELEVALRQKLARAGYDSCTTPEAFSQQLETDLDEWTGDRHFGVSFDPAFAPHTLSDGFSAEEQAQMRDRGRSENYGVAEARILPGNVGYLLLSGFSAPPLMTPKISAAMQLLSDADALIVDVRTNPGGFEASAYVLCTYLFPEWRAIVHLNSAYDDRRGPDPVQFWTLPSVPGPRFVDKPVYVLTNRQTGSAAEAFGYALQAQKRATIVGDTTGGSAHPSDVVIAYPGYVLQMPVGRNVNPVTKTDWEGVGVVPDVKVDPGKALEKAQVLALEHVLGHEKSDAVRANLQWTLDGLRSTAEPRVIEVALLERLVGTYGPRKITLEEDGLHYQRENGTRRKLVPLDDHTFALEGAPYFRVRFVEEGGKVTALQGFYQDGRIDRSPRN